MIVAAPFCQFTVRAAIPVKLADMIVTYGQYDHFQIRHVWEQLVQQVVTVGIGLFRIAQIERGGTEGRRPETVIQLGMAYG